MASEDDSDCEKEEGLRLLLGGLAVVDITASAWDNQSEGSLEIEADVDVQCSKAILVDQTRHSILTKTFNTAKRSTMRGADDDVLFSRALAVNAEGRMERPGVSVVDLSQEGRGNALIAIQKFTKGQVIYTEQAAMASQLVGDRVHACQFCFQSLEPISACCRSQWTGEMSHTQMICETKGYDHLLERQVVQLEPGQVARGEEH